MNESNTKSLIAVAPKLFEWCKYFECGDGWMQLLFVAARQLEALDQGLKAAQVKEKYGTLRFYLDAYTPESEAIIEQAEKRSAETCEVCGNFGELRAVRGWYTTRCDECGL